MARTERGKYTFVVREFGNGTPWITVESTDESRLGILEGGLLCLHLKPDTDRAEAEKIVSYLNAHVDVLSYTDLSNLPHAPGDV